MTDWVLADPLDTRIITGLLTTRVLGRELELHRSLPSTSDRVRERAGEGAPAGLVVFAEEQTRGRGRGGSRWESPPGTGIWLSALLPPGIQSPGLVMLGAGVAVARAVERVSGVRTALKWPNDLEIAGAKLCGILGEMSPQTGVVLGIGVNVHAVPAGMDRHVIALDDAAGRPVARNPLVAAILGDLEAVLDEVEAGRSGQVLAAWRTLCCHMGARVRITTGEEVVGGVADSVSSTGALILRCDDGRLMTITSGSLSVES